MAGVIRNGLAVFLTYGAYHEAGPHTAGMLVMIWVGLEVKAMVARRIRTRLGMEL